MMTLDTTCVSYCSDIDGSILAAGVLIGYGAVISIIASCGIVVGRRLHEFAKECALERHRQNEMIERLLMLYHDSEEEDVDFLAHEQPPTNGNL